jgi:cation:H+ antiporter
MWLDFLILGVGGFFVWLGAEGMVLGAVKLARYFGVPSLIVGLTVVAFGTSAPELVVSSIASIKAHNQIALGNVIGSNIINIGLVLGLSAIIRPITVSADLLKRDLPFVVVVTLAVIVMAWVGDGLSRIDGVILLCGFVGHTVMSYRLALKEQARTTTAMDWEQPELLKKDVVYLIGGTIVLSLGAEGMVRGAVEVAAGLGIDQKIIGMTIVAFGTSVPELAASVVAARHGESDLALGNVIGSNLYNILLILGTASVIRPIASDIGLHSWDFMFFAGIVLVLAPMLRFGWRLGRVDGLVLLGIYVASVGFLFI